MKRTAPVHKLRPNETCWTPPAVVTFDTETRAVSDGGTETHYLRCWVARLDVRRDKRKSAIWQDSAEGTDPRDLAATIAAWSRRHPTLWVYAHNLAFDLTTSSVTTGLSDHGYGVTEFAIDSPSPFVKMSAGRSHVTFADSFSWLPARLDEVASRMGTSKVPLPGNDDELEFWFARCRVDVDILADAMLCVMQWWDDNNLGHWSVTGSAAGWNVMRHKIDAGRIVINTTPAGIQADRKAVYGGRRALFRSGTLPGGEYGEYDFTAAYPTIAENLPLPLERMSSFTSLPVDHKWVTSDRHSIIARVRVKTSVPRWPARVAGRVWYPIGEFWTHLAGPDIAEAARLGCLLEIGEGWVHRLGYVLKPWAEWCLATSRGDDDSVPQVVRMWAKHCGRAVIGKWAQRSFDTVEIGPAPTRGWWASDGWNHTQGVRAVIIDFDGRRWQASASGDGDNCYPAVLAFVEAYVRVRLGRMIESMPAGAAVSADTDGMMIDLGRLREWEPMLDDLWPLIPRLKRTYSRVEMIGPQHMVLDGARRFAGIPSSATPDPQGTYSAQLWPKMVWQMGESAQGEYKRPTQVYRIAATYAPGWVLDTRDVVPVECAITGDGNNKIVRWEECSHHEGGAVLAPDQNKDLARYHNASTAQRNRPNQATGTKPAKRRPARAATDAQGGLR